ncbi:gp436 family protein [Massilia sp. NR 4-1]|uniref:gp436 family protein n=1 Tax=Massilia sp. NR 4-1 TaxID=1678028 RepID=UPI00067B5AE0|nr:DUF1320 domain-containing protein [Massilia sp. NR 4-1]AKU21877.1 hypothetical protein ACZ75_10760 [Massilia sp. NR 4-1]
MPYATRLDMEQSFGADEIAQRESALPAGAVDKALRDASAMIDGYLAGRYGIPLSVVPANLPPMAGAIARYYLLGDAATERARNDYKDAIAWLKDVQAGRVFLQAAAAPPSNSTAAGTVMMASSTAVFKRAGRP